jgi:hypothetical protein
LYRDVRRAENARYAGKVRGRELAVKRAKWAAEQAKWAACPNHGLVASLHESVQRDETVECVEIIRIATKPTMICWECKSGWPVANRNYVHP